MDTNKRLIEGIRGYSIKIRVGMKKSKEKNRRLVSHKNIKIEVEKS